MLGPSFYLKLVQTYRQRGLGLKILKQQLLLWILQQAVVLIHVETSLKQTIMPGTNRVKHNHVAQI